MAGVQCYITEAYHIDDRLLCWLANGETLRLHVEGAPQWQAARALQQQRLRRRDA